VPVVAQLKAHPVEFHLDGPALAERHRRRARQHGGNEARKLLARDRHTARVSEPASRDGNPGSIYSLRMASAGLSRRVEKVVAYPPLSEIGGYQRREFREALLEADSFEDLPGKWQAAIVKAEENRANLRIA
jgi:hypothetical protein